MARQLPPWTLRPAEVANLLNPAFTSLLLRSAARGYAKEAVAGLPLNLTFLVLPIVLHRNTRVTLPTSTRTRLHTWLRRNQATALGFGARAHQMVPYTREALLFGAQQGIVTINQAARVEAANIRIKPLSMPKDSEARECIEMAELVGRLFARSGDPMTILSMWGVRP